MKYWTLAILAFWGTAIHADVYRWVDEKGETHFSETVPAQGAKDVKREITQQQIQQIEKSDQASQQQPPSTDSSIGTLPPDSAGDPNAIPADQEFRMSECVRYKQMRENLTMGLDPGIEYSMSHNFGKGVLMQMYNSDGSIGLTDMNKIEQGIRQNCSD